MPDIKSVMIKRNAPEKVNRISPGRIVFRVLLCIFTACVLAIGTCLGGILVVEFGPSKTARDEFVVMVMQDESTQFLATWFLGDEKVTEIINSEAGRTNNADKIFK